MTNYDSIEVTKRKIPSYDIKGYRPSEMGGIPIKRTQSGRLVKRGLTHEEVMAKYKNWTNEEKVKELFRGRTLEVVKNELDDMKTFYKFCSERNNVAGLTGLIESIRTYKSNLSLYEHCKNLTAKCRVKNQPIISKELLRALPQLRSDAERLEEMVSNTLSSITNQADCRLYEAGGRNVARPRAYGVMDSEKDLNSKEDK